MNDYTRTLALGDIHGNFKALDQCFERCGYDPNSDLIIQLGDVSDRYPDTYKVVKRLIEIPHLIAIRGNHDKWTCEWLFEGRSDSSWLDNGGKETIESYNSVKEFINLDDHKEFFFEKQQNFYIDDSNRIFVHGGFTHPEGPNHDSVKDQCLSDRSLWNEALLGLKLNQKPNVLENFNEIYIGHTPTLNWSKDTPMNAFNVWNLDTGAGSSGKLTIMDIDSKEYWQSDLVDTLY